MSENLQCLVIVREQDAQKQLGSTRNGMDGKRFRYRTLIPTTACPRERWRSGVARRTEHCS